MKPTSATAVRPPMPTSLTSQKRLEGVSVLYVVFDDWANDSTRDLFNRNGAQIEITNTTDKALAKLPGRFSVIVIEDSSAFADEKDLIKSIMEKTGIPIVLYGETSLSETELVRLEDISKLEKGKNSDSNLITEIETALAADLGTVVPGM